MMERHLSITNEQARDEVRHSALEVWQMEELHPSWMIREITWAR